jgi:hypothetical protein
VNDMNYKDRFIGKSGYAAQQRLLVRLVVLMVTTDISIVSKSQFRSICGIFKSIDMEIDGDCKKVLLSAIDESIDTANLCCAAVRSRILNDEVVDELSPLYSQALANKSELDRLRNIVRTLSPIQCFALIDRIEEALDDHVGSFEEHFERVFKKIEGSEYL